MKKYFYISTVILVSLCGLVLWQASIFSDGKLHVVFCNVGQGDAIFIRTPAKVNMLVDGGPDDSVLSCIASHTPFWERKIDLVVMTHPHADHMTGFFSLLQQYKVAAFATERLSNNTDLFRWLMDTLDKQKIVPKYMIAGQNMRITDGVKISVVGPSQSFLQQTSPNGKIGESNEFSSLELLISYGGFKVFLTGDSQADELQEAIDSGYVGHVAVLQSPHHGSKTGLTDNIIQTLYPKLAVISVGKNNKYGHPNVQTLGLLKSNNINIARTDQSGDIEIISDGKTWTIR